MKRLFGTGLALLALGVGVSGCVDLDEKLVSNLGASYVGTPQGLTDATNAIYAGLRGFYGRGETDYALTLLGTDTWTAADQVSSGGAQNWIYYDTYEPTYTSQGAFLDAFWGWGYTMINRANTVLDQGEKIPVGPNLSQAVKDSRLGEAHFLRALAYFELVQQFGGLTINLHAAQGVSTEATRETEDSTYKVIISDLEQAIELLPVTQADYGRATKGAAQNLLAKVYLTRAYRDWNTANKQADFQKALDLAKTVINSGQYSLVPNYASLWCGTHRAAVPPDPGGQSFCDLTNYSKRNSEFIFVAQYSYDNTQYDPGQTNYDHVEFLSHYDGDPGFAAGLVRDLDNGRPFRRLRPTPALLYFFDQTRWAGPPGPNTDVLDTRFDGSFQTVWFANTTASNPTGTCPKCTSGATMNGTLLRDAGGSPIGAAAGSDTALVYLGYQVSDDYRRSKAYRIATPCTTAPTEDCGKDNDAKGIFGNQHYPSLKKWQDNLRVGGFFSQDGAKDFPVMRLGETYLIAAEAAVGLGQPQVAADMINVLRVRAACAGPPQCKVSHKSDPAILVNASQMTLDFIMDERARELAGEYKRWTDLHRPGKEFFLERIRKYNPYARPNITDKHYYRPIPQRQINGVTGTPYPQNPGW